MLKGWSRLIPISINVRRLLFCSGARGALLQREPKARVKLGGALDVDAIIGKQRGGLDATGAFDRAATSEREDAEASDQQLEATSRISAARVFSSSVEP